MTFRTEEKLKIHPSRLPEFLGWLAESEAVIVHPPRRVISIYLDNDRLGMFHDSMEGVLPRKKLRFRRYEPRDKPTTSWRLESKVSSVEGRFKTSSPSDVNPPPSPRRSPGRPIWTLSTVCRSLLPTELFRTCRCTHNRRPGYWLPQLLVVSPIDTVDNRSRRSC